VSFTISQSQLFGLVSKTYPVAPSKSSLQILSNIKISCQGDDLELVATDLDHSVKAQQTIEGGDTFDIAVSARKAFDIVREIPEGALTVDVDENVLCITSEKGFSCKIAGADVQDFPAFPEVSQGTVFSVSVADLKRMVVRSSFAVSKDTSRSCLCGILWEIEKNRMVMVATDGHRLGRCEIAGDFPVEKPVLAIVSPKTILHLIKIAESSKDAQEINVSIGDKYVSFSLEGTVICSKLIEGPYPDYDKVIPKENPKMAVIDKATLLSSVKRVSVLSNQKTHMVKFVFSAGNLEIVVLNRDIGGEARESIPVEYNDEDHVIGLNSFYFSEILSIVDTPRIRLEMNTQISACLIFPHVEGEKEAGSDDLFLIMPLRIMDEA